MTQHQPSGSTMRPIRDTISLEEALAAILDAARPVTRTERLPLRAADGRVIAAPLTAWHLEKCN